LQKKTRHGVMQEHEGVPNIDTYLPTGDPGWNPNTGGRLQKTKEYQKIILYGIQHGFQKFLIWAKLYECNRKIKNSYLFLVWGFLSEKLGKEMFEKVIVMLR